MEKKFKLNMITMPNFILVEGITNGNVTDSPKISVADLTESEAIEYAELMRATFMEHWKKKRTTDYSDVVRVLNSGKDKII